MSLSDWIQLFRNGFCVVRSIAGSDSPLFNVPFPKSAWPLTIVDFAIVSTQLPAVYFFGSGGVISLITGESDIRKYRKLLLELDRFHFEDLGAVNGVGPETVTAVLRHGMQSELDQAKRRYRTGVCQLLIAIAFVYFSLNTLRIRFRSHPLSVINAVVLLLSGLGYMLYTMVRTMIGRYTTILRTRKLKKRLRNSSNGNSVEEIVALLYRAGFGNDMMDGLLALTASHDTGTSPLAFQYKTTDIADYAAAVESDLATVSAALQALRQEEESNGEATATPRRHTRSKARASTASSQVSPSLLRSLNAHIRAQFRSLGLTAAFFVLNAIAGYGYLMPVLAFYLPHEALPAGSVRGALVKLAMFAQPSAVADWWGTLAGDLAWTIEPLLTMASPAILKVAQKLQESHSYTVEKVKSE